MVETLLFLGEKLIDLFDQFQELLGVLLDRSLFAQPEPAFFSFALHGCKYYPMGTIARNVKSLRYRTIKEGGWPIQAWFWLEWGCFKFCHPDRGRSRISDGSVASALR
jgi:hypothetical protein